MTARNDFSIRGVARNFVSGLPSGIESIAADLMEETDFSKLLSGIDVVVHAAARVHVMKDHSLDPLAEFREANVVSTLKLAHQSARAGVRRFVFVSSIKVNGESTLLGCPFKADDAPAPEDAYGISKAEAEAGLLQMAQETGMEVVIIRPPLVYGPGAKGNFSSLLRWVAVAYHFLLEQQQPIAAVWWLWITWWI